MSCGRPKFCKVFDSFLCSKKNQDNDQNSQVGDDDKKAKAGKNGEEDTVMNLKDEELIGLEVATDSALADAKGDSDTVLTSDTATQAMKPEVAAVERKVETAIIEEEVEEEIKEEIVNEVQNPKMVFYMNMHLMNKDKVIEQYMVSSAKTKIGKSFGSLTSGLASKMVSDETIINEIAKELLAGFPKEMESVGVKGTYEQVFTKGSFTVVQVKLFGIDLDKAVTSEFGGEGAKHYQNIMNAMKFFEMSQEEIDTMIAELEMDSMKEIPEEIGKEMKKEFLKEGLMMGVTCKLESEQGPFLFDYLSKFVQ